MTTEIELYKEIAQRERLSRKEAERLLEVKALELYEKTLNVERTKSKVEALNNLLLNVMESSPDGIITCSQDLVIQAINLTAERQFGYNEIQLVGKPIDFVLPGFQRAIQQTHELAFEFKRLEALDSNGETCAVEVRGTREGKQDQAHFVLFVHDITKEIEAQRALKIHEHQVDEARRLEAIGTLSAGIAHEINTPIQFIGDNMGFLTDSLEKIYQSYSHYEDLRVKAEAIPELCKFAFDITKYNEAIELQSTIAEIYESVKESVDGIEQVRDIVLLMKEFAHPGTGNEELADINDIIHSLVKISHNKYRDVATIQQNLPADLPHIECRRGQIQQVLLNMMVNAVDAIEESGRTPGVIALCTSHDAEYVHIRISDTGNGVPQSLKDKIFDPFFTTKPVGKGTGQGLALAKDFIVSGHNGLLRFIDIPGFATTFQISLPRRQKIHLLEDQKNAA